MPKGNVSSRDEALELSAPTFDTALGCRIREARRKRGLSIRKLAEKCGLSIGMISQIESAKSDPSLRSLRLIGDALNISLGELFNQDEHRPVLHPNVVRHFERAVLKDNSLIKKELLSPPGHQDFEIYSVVLQPGGNSGNANYAHAGEKAAIVMSGELTIWLNDEPLILKAGDTVQFPSQSPHRYANEGSSAVDVIWILSSTPS